MSLLMMIWIFELLMFRNRGWMEDPLFYPIAGLFLFSMLNMILSGIFSNEVQVSYLGSMSFFILLIRRFVKFAEKRKMIIWTFISGVVLTSGLDLVGRFSAEPFDLYSSLPASDSISFMMIIVFGFVLSFYAESKGVKEKLFFGLVSLPMAIVAVLSFNKAAILYLVMIVIIIGAIKDRTILIPLTILIIAILFDFIGIRQLIIPQGFTDFLLHPIRDIAVNINSFDHAGFFGNTSLLSDYIVNEALRNSYLLRIVYDFGPPLLLLFLWIIAEKTRMNFIRFKKIQAKEIRAYHLGTLLMITAALLMNFYGSTFDSKSAVLAFWLILGMSEI